MSLWSWSELTEALRPASGREGGEGKEGAAPDIDNISIDSRTLRPGELFVALDGELQGLAASSGDGHDFVADAAGKGAAAALVHREGAWPLPVLRVADTFDGLRALARHAVARCPGKRVAVTGSSGKTTLRAFIETMTRDQARAHASTGSFNNHLGVPLSLARMPRDTQFATFEVGMNRPGEIAPLSRLIAPQVAVVLNVAPVHLGNFSSFDALRREKLAIRLGLQAGGALLLPDDLEAEEGGERLLRFGLSRRAQVRALQVDGRRVRAELLGRRLDYLLPGPGRHRVLTSLAALGVAAVLEMDLERAAESLQKVAIPVGRGNRVRVGDITLVDETYNANPLATGIALETLGKSDAKRKLAVIGDMLELGDAAPGFHRRLADACGALDLVCTVGPLALELYRALPKARRWRHLDSCDELQVDWLAAELRPGDELLIKGSNKLFWRSRTVPKLLQQLTGEAASEDAAG